MNVTSTVARRYSSNEVIELEWDSRQILRVEPREPAGAVHRWIMPPLLDIQINGFTGIDFQAPDLSLHQFEHAATEIKRAGCGGFCPTLITNSWDAMISKLKNLRSMTLESDLLLNTIAGWHLEGPFLSQKQGFHGAHDPALMCDPSPSHLEELRETAGNDRVIVSLAPERRGAVETIKRAADLDIIVTFAHTDASQKELEAAINAGAKAFTHLGNGCPKLLDRHDNIILRALDTPDLFVSVIPDKIHAPPPLFRLIHKAMDANKVFYISDAMAGAGMSSGRYTLGNLEIEVGPDKIARLPGQPLYAGSTLRPVDAVFKAAEMLNTDWLSVWQHYSSIPKQLLGDEFRIQPGAQAGFCLVDCTSDNRPVRIQLVNGEEVTDVEF